MGGLRFIFRMIRRQYGYGAAIAAVGILSLLMAIFSGDPLDRRFGIICALICFAVGGVLIFVRLKKNEQLEKEQAEAQAEAERRKKSDPHYYDNYRRSSGTVPPSPAPVRSSAPAPSYTPPSPAAETPPQERELSEDEINDLKKKLTSEFVSLPMILLEPVRGSAEIWGSKLGGVPYMPKDFTYPCGRGDFSGKPLKLLAQLNFDELPGIKGFPETGILQFFCACGENDCFGLGRNIGDMCSGNGFRVIYHRDIVKDSSRLMTAEDMPRFTETDFPFEGEFVLIPKKLTMCRITSCDFRFSDALGKYRDIDEEVIEKIYDSLLNESCCIGGYPNFTQDDPREYSAELQDKTVMLFQLDSDADKGIMWGDCGTGNFFISPRELAALDFSSVLFSWDCC